MNKDYRRDWAQERARQKLRELRGLRWSDTKIGEKTGVSGQFIGTLLREKDPKPISEKVWDALVKDFGVDPNPPANGPVEAQTETVGADAFAQERAQLHKIIATQAATIERQAKRIEEFGAETAILYALAKKMGVPTPPASGQKSS